MYKGTLIHTITSADIGHSILDTKQHGKVFLSGTLGYVQPCDLGKQLYLSDGIVQIENSVQLSARLKK